MITKKKKIIVLSTMVALLVLTGFLNLTFNQNLTTTTGGGLNTMNFFESYRIDRDSSREQQVLYYNAVLNSANSSQTAKESAESSLLSMADKEEQELLLENYIIGKGFEDVVVSFTKNYVNVMVKAPELTEMEVAQIVQVVQEQTSKGIDNIKIIPVE